MPVMEPNLDAATLQAWAQAIDDGPFSSLCWGERIAFDNPESLTLLGALAAWTDRVRLVTTVVVPQLHDPVMLAKALATGDMLSGGRLTVGLGVGGRHEDYHAVGADIATQTMRGMADSVAVMRRIWAGEKVTESVVPVGPPPLQASDRNCWSAPRSQDRAQCGGVGRRAGGYDPGSGRRQGERAVRRRADGMGSGGQAKSAPGDVVLVRDRRRAMMRGRRSTTHLRRYMNWIPAEYVDAMAPTTGWAGTDDELVEVLRRIPSHRHRRGPSDPNEFGYRSGAAGR